MQDSSLGIIGKAIRFENLAEYPTRDFERFKRVDKSNFLHVTGSFFV
jgi:hypothetical protein